MSTILSHSVNVCAQIVAHNVFRWFIIATIIFAGVVIGIETYPPLATRYHNLLQLIDTLILAIFAIEIVLKLIACGQTSAAVFSRRLECL